MKGVVVITGEGGTIPGEVFEPSACFIRVDGSSPVEALQLQNDLEVP